MTEDVLTQREGAVLHVTFNRPAKKNALTLAMYRALEEALKEADRDDAIGAIMLSGAGGTFTAGNDLGDFLAAGQRKPDGQAAHAFVSTIAACQTPIVAAVEGMAIGVGTTMIFHCDLVYAAPSALFRMPFVDLGLVPEAGSSLLVPLRVGMAKATELLMLGDGFDAEEAVRLGIANGVIEAGRLLAHAHERASRLAAKPRNALRATRRLMRGDHGALQARIEEETTIFAAALNSDEARAAFTAFLTKKAG